MTITFKQDSLQGLPSPVYKKILRFSPQGPKSDTRLIERISSKLQDHAKNVRVEYNCINFSGVNESLIGDRCSMLKKDSLGKIFVNGTDSTIEYQLSIRNKLKLGLIFLSISYVVILSLGFTLFACLFLSVPAFVFTFFITFDEIAGVDGFLYHIIREEAGLEDADE